MIGLRMTMPKNARNVENPLLFFSVVIIVVFVVDCYVKIVQNIELKNKEHVILVKVLLISVKIKTIG
jgi:hypothetical protein